MFLNDLLNVLLGVIASLIGWLLLTKILRPRIILGDAIDHVFRKDSTEYYRLTYKNPRIRRYLRGQRRLVQHVTLQLDRLEGSRFLADLPRDCPPITCLGEFLRQTDATIEFAVRAADGYSGVYRTVARVYKAPHVSIVDRRAQQTAVDSDKNDGDDTFHGPAPE